MDEVGEKQICNLALSGIKCYIDNLEFALKEEKSDFVEDSIRSMAHVWIQGLNMINYNCKAHFDEEDKQDIEKSLNKLRKIRGK